MKKLIAFFSIVVFSVVVTQKTYAFQHVKAKVEISKAQQIDDLFVNDALIVEIKPDATVEGVYLKDARIDVFYSIVLPVANSPPDRCS